jgi:hypothetical protein
MPLARKIVTGTILQAYASAVAVSDSFNILLHAAVSARRSTRTI